MPPLATGLFSFIGIGRESTWGTSVARTKFIEFLTESLRLEVARVFSETLSGVSQRRYITGKRMVGPGDIEAELLYEGWELLWQQAFGLVTTSALAAPAFQHVFSLTDVLRPGLSLEVKRDIKAYLYEGCKISSFTVIAEVDRILRARMTVVGEDESLLGSPTSLVLPPEKPIPYSHLTAKLDDTLFDCVSFEFTCDDNLFIDRRKLGAVLVKEMSRNGMRTVSGTVVIDYEDETFYNKYPAGTEFKLNLIATGAAIGASGVNETYDFEFARCVSLGQTPNVDNAGPLRVTIPFQALYKLSPAAEPVKLTVKNAVTTV